MPNGQYITRQYTGVQQISSGGGGGGAPTFIRESLRLTADGGFASVVPMALTGMTTIVAGHRAVLALAVAQTITVTSLTDSQGNTWAVDLTGTSSGQSGIAVCSSNLTNALTTADTITVTFSDTAAFVIAGSLIDLSGCATSGQPDSSAGVTHSFGNAVSISGNTVAAKTVAIGVLTNDSNGTDTYGSSSWTIVGGVGQTYSNSSSRICYFVTQTFSVQTTGANPGGAWSGGSVDQINGWAAYK